MKLVEITWRPSARQLRQFGLVCLFALPLAGWVWGATAGIVVTLAALGIGIAATSLLRPNAIKPLFIGMSLVAAPIGIVIGELAVLVIFFVIFLAAASLFRLIGRDALELRFNRAAATYWQPKRQSANVATYYRQS